MSMINIREIDRSAIIVLLMLMLMLLACGCDRKQQAEQSNVQLPTANKSNETDSQSRVCFKEHCFSVELAITQHEQTQGLMFRRHMDADKGMLFIFQDEDIYNFWMMNTLLPLDIIWIDSDKEVVFINKNSHPCRPSYCPSINPGKKAKYVLEINAGITDMIGLKQGDKLSIYE